MSRLVFRVILLTFLISASGLFVMGTSDPARARHSQSFPAPTQPLGGVVPRQVSGVRGPIAAFTWESCALCMVPGDLVFFNGNWSVSPGSSIVSYSWNFGDGSAVVTGTIPSINHDYFGYPSKWLVILNVTDSLGRTDSVSQLVVFSTVPRFTFHPSKPMVGQLVVFNGSNSIAYYGGVNPITGYLWDFGDGTTGSGVVVRHAYSTVGFYRVTLTLVTAQGNPVASKTLKVRLAGDVDDDCVVNSQDLGEVGAAMFTQAGQPGYDERADLLGNGVINALDLGVVGTNFMRSCS